MLKRGLLAAAFLVLIVLSAPADTLYLKNGSKFEGQVVKKDAKSVVFKIRGLGPQTFDLSDVDRIEEGESIYDEYETRRAAVAAGDAKGHYELGLWCMEQGLRQEGLKAFRAAIAADPEHADARRVLGYKKVRDQWLDRVKYRKYREQRQKELEAVLGNLQLGDEVWEEALKLGCRSPRGWERAEVSGGLGVEFRGPTLNGVRLVIGFETADPLDREVFKAGVVRGLKARAEDLRPIRADSPASIGGLMAKENVCRFGPAEAEVERHDAYLVHEDCLVHAWFETPLEDGDAVRGIFNGSLNSVSFEKKVAGAPEGGRLYSYELPGDDWTKGVGDLEGLNLLEDMSGEIIHHDLHPAVILISTQAGSASDVPDPAMLRRNFAENVPGVRILDQETEVTVAGVKGVVLEFRGTFQQQAPIEGLICIFSKSDHIFLITGMNLLGSMDMKYFRQDFAKLLASFKVR